MSGDARQRDLLPLACTLTPAAGAARFDEWRALFHEYGAGRTDADGLVTFRFRNAPEVAGELVRLVDAERDCCAFLGWDLEQADDVWTLRISGTADALRTLSLAD
jgi:hypothetical protein